MALLQKEHLVITNKKTRRQNNIEVNSMLPLVGSNTNGIVIVVSLVVAIQKYAQSTAHIVLMKMSLPGIPEEYFGHHF